MRGGGAGWWLHNAAPRAARFKEKWAGGAPAVRPVRPVLTPGARARPAERQRRAVELLLKSPLRLLEKKVVRGC